MTEQQLIDLGFNKVEVKDSESQNGYDYFFYTLDVFNNLTLNQFKLQTKEEVDQFLQVVNHSFS